MFAIGKGTVDPGAQSVKSKKVLACRFWIWEGICMPRKKDPPTDLEMLSVKLPKQTVATVRRLARTQGRLLQFVVNEAISAGLLALERSK